MNPTSAELRLMLSPSQAWSPSRLVVPALSEGQAWPLFPSQDSPGWGIATLHERAVGELVRKVCTNKVHFRLHH